jgi:hypothetical protein
MGWGAAISGVVGLYGASQQKKAASAQKDAAQAQLDFQQNVYNQSQQNYAPYLQAGQQGLAALQGNQYEQSPGYQYLKDEQLGAVDASAAARGQLYSGGHSLDLMRHAEGLAAQDYNNWWSRQMGLANLGQASAAGVGAAGQAAANGMASGYGNLANAQGSQYGAIAGGLTGLGGLLTSAFGGGSSSYGGGSNASSFGLPAPVDPYAGTSWSGSTGSGWNNGSYFG